jgi:hypothetical protein
MQQWILLRRPYSNAKQSVRLRLFGCDRNVFTNGGSHTDITPRDAGMGPYDQLTPILW